MKVLLRGEGLMYKQERAALPASIGSSPGRGTRDHRPGFSFRMPGGPGQATRRGEEGRMKAEGGRMKRTCQVVEDGRVRRS